MELLFGIWPNSLLGTGPNGGPIVALPQLRLTSNPGPPARVRLASKISPFFPPTLFLFSFFNFCVLWCCGVVWCVFKIFVVRPRFPSAGPSQKFAPFFHSPATFFVLSPSLGCPYFGWCFEGLHPRMCTLGLSNSKRAHFKAPALQTQPKFHEKTPEREKTRAKVRSGRQQKKLEILGSQSFGPPSGRPPPNPPTTPTTPQQHPNNTSHNEHHPTKTKLAKCSLATFGQKMAKCGQSESVPKSIFFPGRGEEFITESVTDTRKTTDKNDPFLSVWNNHGKKVGGQKWGKMQCGVSGMTKNTLVFMELVVFWVR